MRKPDWFVLIEQWKAKGMGTYGISLPFLVGALTYKSGQLRRSSHDIRELLQEIIANPVADYVTEVRWCGDIGTPVFSVSRMNQPYRMPLKSCFLGPHGEASLGFSEDLQSMFGLNCSGSDECLEKLISYAAPHVEKGHFSRIVNSTTGEHEYRSFLPNEIQYIADTIGTESSART